MKADDFTLQHSDTPQPVLYDEEICTADAWPLPDVRGDWPFDKPRKTLTERIAEWFDWGWA